jgi:FAD/FMN-containing dehydrogenase
MGHFNSVSVDKEAQTATFGGGCKWGEVYEAVNGEGLMAVGGGYHGVGESFRAAANAISFTNVSCLQASVGSSVEEATAGSLAAKEWAATKVGVSRPDSHSLQI